MPPRNQGRFGQRPARPRGYDPTVSIASASAAKTNLNAMTPEEEPIQQETKSEQSTNDDLKKLIEALKSKMGVGANAPAEKKAPPVPQAKNLWNRSLGNKESKWAPKPAYTILSRISNHEKVPTKTLKQSDPTINSLPHSFLYKPGVDGIKVDKLNVKAGKQLGIG